MVRGERKGWEGKEKEGGGDVNYAEGKMEKKWKYTPGINRFAHLGCRMLDCWDGSSGEICIVHGVLFGSRIVIPSLCMPI